MSRLRNGLLFPWLLVGAVTVLAVDSDGGNVNGYAEQPIIDQIGLCRDHERAADALVASASRRGKLDAETASHVRSLLEKSIECLQMTRTKIENLEVVLATTSTEDALDALIEAEKHDTIALALLNKGAKTRHVRSSLRDALSQKYRAIVAMQGRPYRFAGPRKKRIKQSQIFVTSTLEIPAKVQENKPAELSDTETVAGSYVETFEGMPPRASPHDYGWLEGDGDLRFKVKKQRGTQNRILELSRPSSAEIPFGILSIPREVRGPFDAFYRTGSFARTDKQAAASVGALTCVEFDVVGTSGPDLLYVAFCAQLISENQVHLFAQTPAGSRPGVVIADRIVDVLIEYDRDKFWFLARPGSGTRINTDFLKEWTFVDEIPNPAQDPDPVFTTSIGGNFFDSPRQRLAFDDLILGDRIRFR